MAISIARSSQRELLTRPEAAQLLGVKPQTLAKWATTQQNGLPYIKVGKSVRYRRSDLTQFMARNTVGTVNDQPVKENAVMLTDTALSPTSPVAPILPENT